MLNEEYVKKLIQRLEYEKTKTQDQCCENIRLAKAYEDGFNNAIDVSEALINNFTDK